MALQVFLDGGLTGVRKFYNQDQKTGGPGGDGQPWAGGRDVGWLVDPWHANYFQPRLFRGLKEGPPPPLKKGMGIICLKGVKGGKPETAEELLKLPGAKILLGFWSSKKRQTSKTLSKYGKNSPF